MTLLRPLILPTRVRGFARRCAPLLWRQLGGTRLPTLHAAAPTERNSRRVFAGVRIERLGFAGSFVYQLLRKCVRVARTLARALRHAPSVAQPGQSDAGLSFAGWSSESRASSSSSLSASSTSSLMRPFFCANSSYVLRAESALACVAEEAARLVSVLRRRLNILVPPSARAKSLLLGIGLGRRSLEPSYVFLKAEQASVHSVHLAQKTINGNAY
jgi:hypothetical protein